MNTPESGAASAALASDARTEDVNARDHLWQTPLYRAASAGDLTAVLRLISAGAKLDARAKKRFTPLHIASRFGHLEVMEVNCIIILLSFVHEKILIHGIFTLFFNLIL